MFLPSSTVPVATCHPQEFLLNGGNLADLRERYHIDVKRHGKYPNLVQLNYNQIASPMQLAIVQDCRGLIVDEDDSWRVVAWPFKKFFNYGEPLAAHIDWTTARVQEKLDGSLLILYYYDEAWQVATSGTPDAACMVHGTNKLFMQLFWDTWYKERWAEPLAVHRCWTSMFELTSPYNRVVVCHVAPKLTLIGMRSIWSGSEISVQHRISYNPVREYNLRTIDDITSTFQTMNPLSQEGYVVVDAAFNRVKVKHPGYVALHHLRSSFSTKKLVDVVRSGEVDELLVHFPEWKSDILGVKAAYDALVVQLEQDWEELQGLRENRKEFAMMARQSVWPAAHFLRLDNQAATAKDALKNVHIDKMCSLLGVDKLHIEAPI